MISVFHVIQAILGFIAEPSFEIGPDAPTTVVFGMDYNGWHAVAGLALFAPGLVLARRNSTAVASLQLAGVTGGAPGIWALFSNQVAIIFTFVRRRSARSWPFGATAGAANDGETAAPCSPTTALRGTASQQVALRGDAPAGARLVRRDRPGRRGRCPRPACSPPWHWRQPGREWSRPPAHRSLPRG